MEREKKKLGVYRDKRAPGVTNEPFGDEASAPLTGADATGPTAFVVHLHSATRRHYDVRLEVGGVLWSFAVPRGPSLDPKEKVLAVKTEDHPLEYVDFEDVIPAGQYGAGPMIVWDRGAVRYLEGPPEEELANGKLHIELEGMKLRGRWAFIKLAKSEKGNEWLLFKKDDAAADPKRAITEELPRSVLSGLTVDELREREAIGTKLVEKAAKLGGKKNDKLAGELSADDRSPLLAASDHHEPAPSADTVYDVELGGVRVLAVRDGDVVTLRTWSHGKPEAVEEYYPDVVRALRALPVAELALDGELVAFDASGRPSTSLLAQRAAKVGKGEVHRAVTTTPVFLVAFDALAFGEVDLRRLALSARRELLEALAPSVGIIRAATPLEGERSRVLATCASLGIASVVAKKKTSTYDAKAGWHTLKTGIAPPAQVMVRHGGHHGQSAPKNVPVTNKDKVFWPGDASRPGKGRYTKGDLVQYYASLADVLLPYLKDRPTILVRYPDGIHGKSFFQWNVPVGMPAWVRTMTMHEADDFVAVPDRGSIPPPSSASRGPDSQKTPRRVFLVDDRATLLYIANLGCIPLHVLASRAPDLTRSDFLTLDFDVKQSELRHAITLAVELGELLEKIGLPGFPKTSGQTGLHVLVPLGPNQTFDTARALADLLGRLLVERHPKIATMERIVSKRGDKVYVDTGQTGTSRAIVAPYSLRAVPAATASTPLAWKEVGPKLDPTEFTIETLPKRVSARGDLLAGLLGSTPDIAKAVEHLSRMISSKTSSKH